MFDRINYWKHLLTFVTTTGLTFCLMELTGKIYGRTIWDDLLWAAIFSLAAVASVTVLQKVFDDDIF